MQIFHLLIINKPLLECNILNFILILFFKSFFSRRYIIKDEYRRMWRALAPLLNENIVAYGFDFNCASRVVNAAAQPTGDQKPSKDVVYSARGSSSFTMLINVNDKWRYFPARVITMTDEEVCFYYYYFDSCFKIEIFV